MTNDEAAAALEKLADILDLAGELPFKAASYRKVATSLRQLAVPLHQVVAESRFDLVAGTGKAIKEKLTAMALTGKLPALEKWEKHEAAALLPVVRQQGVKPRPLGALARTLGTYNVDELKAHLRARGINTLPPSQKEVAKELIGGEGGNGHG